MGPALRLGKVGGIPILVHFSWVFIVALVYVTLLTQFHDPAIFPRSSTLLRWGLAGVTTLLFFGCVLAHELAHSLVAVRLGIAVRSITLFLFGGVSHLSREASRPFGEFAIALSGPLSSALLGGFFLALRGAGLGAHGEVVVSLLAYYNFALAVFNMLPGFPLDGGRVLRAVLWGATGNYRRATRLALAMGEGLAFLFMAGGLALGLGLRVLSGLWLALVGWFLWTAARTSAYQVRLQEALQGLRVADLMQREFPAVSPFLPLSRLVEDYLLARHRPLLLVLDGETPIGVVRPREVRRVPRSRWADTPVHQVMVPLTTLSFLDPTQEAVRTLELLEEAPLGLLVVVQGGRATGLITRDILLHSLQVRRELGL